MESSMQIGQKALITTDAWFYAPDGRQYRAVFGTVKAVRTSEETLGVRTNARSTNWYVEIGLMIMKIWVFGKVRIKIRILDSIIFM